MQHFCSKMNTNAAFYTKSHMLMQNYDQLLDKITEDHRSYDIADKTCFCYVFRTDGSAALSFSLALKYISSAFSTIAVLDKNVISEYLSILSARSLRSLNVLASHSFLCLTLIILSLSRYMRSYITVHYHLLSL